LGTAFTIKEHFTKLPRIVQMSVSTVSAFFLDEEGRIYSYLPRSLMSEDERFSQPFNVEGVKHIAADGEQIAFIDSEGVLWLELAEEREWELQAVEDLPELDRIFCGSDYYCALDLDGVPWLWGMNRRGRLGVGQENLFKRVKAPIPIDFQYPIMDVFCGNTACLFIDSQGSLWMCGSLADSVPNIRPVRVQTGGRVKGAACDEHRLAVILA
jgi:alpha-tubulin suppressor-like RCC1 family protein